jgi:hypothetical protein
VSGFSEEFEIVDKIKTVGSVGRDFRNVEEHRVTMAVSLQKSTRYPLLLGTYDSKIIAQ